MSAAITFQNIVKIYRTGFWGQRNIVLDKLNFAVPQNCIYGFLGANGAGKTTAIKLLMDLQRPNFGNILLYQGSNNSLEARAKIGYLPERPYFHDNLTATEFLDFHRSLYGHYKKKHGLKSNAELLEVVGLASAQKKLLRNFSKGMLQRIGIAQALVNDPDLLIFDEPMSGLDPIGRRDIRNLMQNLYAQGKTVFFSTHILSDVEVLCHKIAFLENGKVKAEGNTKDIILAKSSSKKEVTFRCPKIDKIKSNLQLKNFSISGENYCIEANDSNDLKRTIEAIWLCEGEIISIESQHLSLEEALFA